MKITSIGHHHGGTLKLPDEWSLLPQYLLEWKVAVLLNSSGRGPIDKLSTLSFRINSQGVIINVLLNVKELEDSNKSVCISLIIWCLDTSLWDWPIKWPLIFHQLSVEKKMYISLVLLSSLFCVIIAPIIYDQTNQGITSLVGCSIPANTEWARYYDNSISHIPTGCFQNLPNLDKIYLHRNIISSIENSAYAGVPSVTYIDLSWNKLSIIRKNHFPGLPNLLNLWIIANEIHTIEPESFKHWWTHISKSAYVYYASHAYWTASARNIFISCMSLTYV